MLSEGSFEAYYSFRPAPVFQASAQELLVEPALLPEILLAKGIPAAADEVCPSDTPKSSKNVMPRGRSKIQSMFLKQKRKDHVILCKYHVKTLPKEAESKFFPLISSMKRGDSEPRAAARASG